MINPSENTPRNLVNRNTKNCNALAPRFGPRSTGKITKNILLLDILIVFSVYPDSISFFRGLGLSIDFDRWGSGRRALDGSGAGQKK